MAVTGLCSGCAGRRGVLVAGCLSVTCCTAVLTASLYCMLEASGWEAVRERVGDWLLVSGYYNWPQAHRDQTGGLWLDWLHNNHQLILMALVTFASFHLVSALMLLLGTLLARHTLLIPWIIIDLLVILIMLVLFTTFTFLSFLVDLLVGIVFPVVGGLLLGAWIVLWRNAYRFYHNNNFNHSFKLDYQDSIMDGGSAGSSIISKLTIANNRTRRKSCEK